MTTDDSPEAWLIWASEGEYSDRTEWPIAVALDEAVAKERTVRLGQLWRYLCEQYKARKDEFYAAGDWQGKTLLTTAEGQEYNTLSGDNDPYFSGDADGRTYTCCKVPVIPSPSLKSEIARLGEKR